MDPKGSYLLIDFSVELLKAKLGGMKYKEMDILTADPGFQS